MAGNAGFTKYFRDLNSFRMVPVELIQSMKPYILLLGASVALAACDSRPTVTQTEPAAPARSQELSVAEQDAIAEKVAQRLAQQREQDARVDAAREAEIREQVRREVEEEFARRDAQNPPAQEPQAENDAPLQQGRAVPVSAWGPDRAGYDMFYDSLNPYGAWYETSDLGFVWQPTVAARNPSWRPYVDGQWADSDQGWIWVSQEPFGWATYHYGRWASLENVGWVWVPGTEWAPAWVSWRETDDYVGWAPLPPRSLQAGASIGSWVDETYDIGPECYNFIPVVQFHVSTYRTVVVNHVENIRIIERTRNVTNIYIKNSNVYLGGPRYDNIKVRCPGLIKTRPIARVNSREQLNVRGNGDTIVVYAPKIDRKEGRPQEVSRKLDRPRVRTGWEGVHDPAAKVRLQATMAGKERGDEQATRGDAVVVHRKTNDRDDAKQNDKRRDNDKSRGDRNDPVRVTYEPQGKAGNQHKNDDRGGQAHNNQQARDNEEKARRDRDNEEKGRQARENEERNRRDRENEQRAQQARENEEKARRNRNEEEKRNRHNAEQEQEKARQIARLEQENKNKGNGNQKDANAEDEEKKKRNR